MSSAPKAPRSEAFATTTSRTRRIRSGHDRTPRGDPPSSRRLQLAYRLSPKRPVNPLRLVSAAACLRLCRSHGSSVPVHAAPRYRYRHNRQSANGWAGKGLTIARVQTARRYPPPFRLIPLSMICLRPDSGRSPPVNEPLSRSSNSLAGSSGSATVANRRRVCRLGL